MTKEELKKEAEEYRLNLIAKLRPKLQEGCNCKELVDIEKAYLAGAEPREKRIAVLEKENAGLREKLTAIRNAKDKYDASKDKSIIQAFGAEHTLFCDLERILEG